MIALLRMSAGLIVWTVAFCMLYGLHGIGCSAGWAGAPMAGTSVHRIVLLVAWLACLVAGAVVALVLRPRAGASLAERTAGRIALVGLAATAITGVPILTLPACI